MSAHPLPGNGRGIATTESSPWPQMRLPLPRLERHQGVGDLPRHHDVRRRHRRGRRRGASSITPPRAASTSSTPPTSTPMAAPKRSSARPSRRSATAGCWPPRSRSRLGPNVTDVGLSRRHLMRAVDASLKRLQTDHIDLYYIHRVDPFTPWEQTIADVRRPDPPGQDPRMGAVQRARLAHPAHRASVPADERAAARGAAALLQPDEPPAGDRAAAGGAGSSTSASCPTARSRAACSPASTR